MKKILACAICLFSLAAANSASAAYTAATATKITMGTGTAGTTNPPLDVQLSSNVQMNYAVTASTGLYYSIAAYHNKGTRTFSSTSNDSKIYYNDTTAATLLTLPTTTASSTPGTGWLSL